MTALYDAALIYASKNWPVFPVHTPTLSGACDCGNPNCGKNTGKHPRIRAWQKNATTNIQQLESWWLRWPDANIGIQTGPKSGILVLDVDPDNGGDDSLFALESQYGKLDVLESITGGGGRHLFFQYPNQQIPNSSSKIAAGLDVRGDGGFIVAPPSLHKSGKFYQWEASSDPIQTLLQPVPGWLLSLVTAGQSTTQPAAPVNSNIQAGKRNNYLTSLAGAMRRKGMTTDEIEAALTVVNANRCVPPLPAGEVHTISQSVARYTPEPTDDILAETWLAMYPDTAYGLGEFRRYQAGVWPVIPYSKVESEILSVMEDQKQNGVKPSSFKLKSVMELARIKTTVDDQRWNANPDILVCGNGTFDILLNSLRNHDKADYMTSGLDFDYDPTAIAQTWDWYLHDTIPGAYDFLQEYAGYCLTVDTKFELAVWLYGPMGTGKSTFITGILAMLGEKAGILGLSDIETSRFALSGITDKTLLACTEQPASFIRATNTINALISGEPVKMERKYREPIVIYPKTKILWAMNELPRIGEAGNGLFRRVKVVEFPLLKTTPNPDIKLTVKQEAPGILNWALAGLQRLKAQNFFTIPPCVTEATQSFKDTNDIPLAFVSDCCITGSIYSILAATLYATYKQWCFDNGHKPQSSTGLSNDWKRLGFTRNHSRIGTVWSGLALKP